MKFSSTFAKAAAIALVAAGATAAHARGDVYFSVGAHVAPGVTLGVSNAPVYYPPVVYGQPVYVQPAPVYYGPPAYYVRPAPVIYSYGPVYQRGHRHHRHHRHAHSGYYRY
jgi:hypothetical protein